MADGVRGARWAGGWVRRAGLHDLPYTSPIPPLDLPYISACTIASSPRSEVCSVGVSGLRPESVTSSTVSPMESTRVALTKETTMYASCSSSRLVRVRVGLGLGLGLRLGLGLG